MHTCDKRRTRSWIHERFPDFDFEVGFSEEDPLWDPEVRETKAEVAERARRALDHIFEDPSYCAFDSCHQASTSLARVFRCLSHCARRNHQRVPPGNWTSAIWTVYWRYGDLDFAYQILID